MKQKVDQSGELTSLCWLIVWPFALGRAAIATPPLTAGIVGGLAWGFIFTLLIAVVSTALWEPFGGFNIYLRYFFPRFLVPAPLVFSFFLFATIGGSFLGRRAQGQYRISAATLLPIPMLIPATFWAISVALADFVILPGVELGTRADELIRVIVLYTGSCMWLPIGLLVMCVALLLAFKQITRQVRDIEGLCLFCGYDLRGSIAAGSERCPECGAAIPPLTRQQDLEAAGH